MFSFDRRGKYERQGVDRGQRRALDLVSFGELINLCVESAKQPTELDSLVVWPVASSTCSVKPSSCNQMKWLRKAKEIGAKAGLETLERSPKSSRASCCVNKVPS